MYIEFKLQELKIQHNKVTPIARKNKDASSPTQNGKSNQHTSIRIPTYKENVDDLEI